MPDGRKNVDKSGIWICEKFSLILLVFRPKITSYWNVWQFPDYKFRKIPKHRLKFSWLDISRSKVSLDNFGQLVLNILPSWQTSWIYHLTESQNSKSINRGKKCPLCVFLSIAWRKKCKQASAFFPSLVCLAIIRWTKRDRKRMKRIVKCETTAMPLNCSGKGWQIHWE